MKSRARIAYCDLVDSMTSCFFISYKAKMALAFRMFESACLLSADFER